MTIKKNIDPDILDVKYQSITIARYVITTIILYMIFFNTFVAKWWIHLESQQEALCG